MGFIGFVGFIGFKLGVQQGLEVLGYAVAVCFCFVFGGAAGGVSF